MWVKFCHGLDLVMELVRPREIKGCVLSGEKVILMESLDTFLFSLFASKRFFIQI